MHGSSGHCHKAPKKSDHFKGSSVLDHILHKRAEGLSSLSETHGGQIPSYIIMGIQTSNESAILFLLTGLLITKVTTAPTVALQIWATASISWILWKTGYTAWRAWIKLERLHRLLEEESYELEENRPQEKEELKVLYAAKGLSGNILDEVIDTIMADDQRALHVMLQEELGLVLGAYDHPLKQALGAFFGGAITAVLCLMLWHLFSFIGLCIAATAILVSLSFLFAYLTKSRIISTIVWNLGLSVLAVSTAHFLWNAFATWKNIF